MKLDHYVLIMICLLCATLETCSHSPNPTPAVLTVPHLGQVDSMLCGQGVLCVEILIIGVVPSFLYQLIMARSL